MAVTIAYVIGIRSLPLSKFFSLLKCLELKRASSYFANRKINRSNTRTGARPDRKARFILGELFDTWSWQPNERKWLWLDGIESCCVGVEGSSKSIWVRCFSPSALSLFRFYFPLFPTETPDTQAIFSENLQIFISCRPEMRGTPPLEIF